MSRKGAILDVDGTLTSGFYIAKFPIALYKSGEFSPRALDKMAYVFIKHKSGNISYEETVSMAVESFGKGVEGKKQENVASVGKRYIEEHPEEIFPFTKDLFNLFKEREYKTLLVSGSPYEIIYPFSQDVGADEVAATSFKTEKGIFTGEVERNCGMREAKENALKLFLSEYDINPDRTTCWGGHRAGFRNSQKLPLSGCHKAQKGAEEHC